ncbi:hypothetical protein D3C73_1267590 [compost metagenome]
MPRRNPVETFEQCLLRRRADQRPRSIEVGDAPIAFRQFDIAACFTGHPDEGIDKTAFGEQGFKRLQIVFAEEPADRQLMPQVSQHLCHVQPFAGGMGVHDIAAVDLTGLKARQLDRKVQRRVEGQG